MAILFADLTPQQEAEAVVNTESAEHERTRKPGDAVFLVSARWFTEWCNYTGYAYDAVNRKLAPAIDQTHPGPRPGPIDSSDLVDLDAKPGDLGLEELAVAARLRAGLQEKVDFWALHEATWKFLKDRYKLGGPEVRRQYIPTGLSKRLELSFDQWAIKAVDEHSGRNVVVPTLSQCTAANLKEACCAALGIDADEHVLMSYADMGGDPETLEPNLHKTLAGLRLQRSQAVLLRRKDHPQQQSAAAATRKQAATLGLKIATPATGANTSGFAPMSIGASSSFGAAGPGSPVLLASSNSPRLKLGSSPTVMAGSPLSRSFGLAPSWAEDAIVPAPGWRPGLAGLSNLGNTCFMNSSLQCLSHTAPLMRTFLTGAYRGELNRDNPLGLGGKLAAAYGALQAKLWRGGVAHVSPKHFKWQLAKFAPQFGGYAQQDSQELLSFLLDGLHEDLNRITEKPYAEEKDAEGRPEWEVAAEAWANYRARNDSVVVDHFQGLLKSTLTCPDCRHQSVKMDPFMYLSLPLPTPKSRTFPVTVVDASGAAPPLRVAVELLKTATLQELVAAVAACCGEGRAEGRWALAHWRPSSRDLVELLTNLKARVSSIQDPRSGGGFSFASTRTQTAQLLAYRFPTAAAGPGGGGRPVVVFHTPKDTYSTTHLTPPSIVFLPPPAAATAAPGMTSDEAAADMATGSAAKPDAATSGAGKGEEDAAEAAGGLRLMQTGKGGYWVLAPGNAVEVAVNQLLTPFRRNPPPPPLTPTAPPAVAQAEAEQPAAVVAAAAAVPPAAQAAPVSSSAAPALNPSQAATVALMEMGSDGGGAEAEADGLAGSGGSMDVDVGDVNTMEEPGSPVHSVDEAISEGDSPVQGPAASPAAGEIGAEVHAVDSYFGPVDMSGPQQGDVAVDAALVSTLGQPCEEEAKQAGDAAAVAVPAAPPLYRLTLGDGASGRKKFAWSNHPPSLVAPDSTEPLFFLAEWDDAAAAEFDRSLWERPAVHPSAAAADAKAASAAPAGVSLSDCVEAFLQPEQLDADDSWYCSKCKAHVQAEKKLDLWRLPEVLVVHLKRFSYSRYSRDKLDTQVDFPLAGLDLRGYVMPGEATAAAVPTAVPTAVAGATTNVPTAASGGAAAPAAQLPPQQPPVYDLYAVSNHYGGLGGGHYTAFCSMPDDGRWYTFDDSSVREVEAEGVRSPAAYVLFYRRRGAVSDDMGSVIKAAAAGAASSGGGASPMDDDTGGFGGGGSAAPSLPLVGEEEEEEEGEAGANAEAAAAPLPPVADVVAAPAADVEDEVFTAMDGLA